MHFFNTKPGIENILRFHIHHILFFFHWQINGKNKICVTRQVINDIFNQSKFDRHVFFLQKSSSAVIASAATKCN